MQFHLLREEPVHSGLYARTGEELVGDAATVMQACAARSADGNRYAVYPYEAIRQDAPVLIPGASMPDSSIPLPPADGPAVLGITNPPAPDAAATMSTEN
jgi:hypothetical protein